MAEAFICAGLRTPIGRYGGSLSSIRTDDLATIPLKELMARHKVVDWNAVDDIIYGVEQLVAYASRVVELRAGDLLLTGSPAGNAAHHGGRWLVPGDLMEGEITGLGIQRNRCVSP